MAVDFEVVPLTETLGAKIVGLKVSEPLSAEATDALRTAFEKISNHGKLGNLRRARYVDNVHNIHKDKQQDNVVI